MNEEEKEKFLEQIHSLPYWIESPEDLMKFSRHILYRLYQTTAELKFVRGKCALTDDDRLELSKLSLSYDDAYGERQEMVSFEEVVEINKKSPGLEILKL